MAKIEHNQDARVLVGIDISKSRHEVLIAAPGKSAPPADDGFEHSRRLPSPDRFLAEL
jgi:hypothetical protein